MMKSGETFELFCSSNHPWFLCIWEGGIMVIRRQYIIIIIIMEILEGPEGLLCRCQTQDGGVGTFCGQVFLCILMVLVRDYRHNYGDHSHSPRS